MFAALRLIAILIPILSVQASHGDCARCSHSPVRDFQDFRNFIREVAVFGNVEHRKTVPEFAAATGQRAEDVQKKYSATGTLICSGREGSAQVTLKDNIITTAAHTLFDSVTCVQKSAPSDCVFMLRGSGGDLQKIKVKELKATGYKCPAVPTPDLDWAVLSLETPAKNVSPYGVESPPVKGLLAGDQVTFVAHSVDFWRKDSGGQKNFS